MNAAFNEIKGLGIGLNGLFAFLDLEGRRPKTPVELDFRILVIKRNIRIEPFGIAFKRLSILAQEKMDVPQVQEEVCIVFRIVFRVVQKICLPVRPEGFLQSAGFTVDRFQDLQHIAHGLVEVLDLSLFSNGLLDQGTGLIQRLFSSFVCQAQPGGVQQSRVFRIPGKGLAIVCQDCRYLFSGGSTFDKTPVRLNIVMVVTNQVQEDLLGRGNLPKAIKELPRCNGFLDIIQLGQTVKVVFVGLDGHLFFIQIQGLSESFLSVEDFGQCQPGRSSLSGDNGKSFQNLPVRILGAAPFVRGKVDVADAVPRPHCKLRDCQSIFLGNTGQQPGPVFRL